MKHSIRRQMIAVFVGLIVCMLVILLLLVGSGLEPYYIREKKDNFTELYNEIDQITQNGEMTEDEISQINRTAERYNFYYIVWNFSNESGFSNLHDSQMLLMQLAGVLFNKIDSQVMEKNDNYQVVEFRDSAQQVDYLALWGTVGDSYNIFIRSPLESIQETMVLFYRFLIIVGLGVIAGGILFVWYFSRRLTEPLRELAVLSARMADLDFDAKYTSGGGGEIGALGENFNTMSEKLEATISELKNANFRLQQDIEQKEKIEKMRTDFMGNVSHELKTPLAVIQNYGTMLQQPNLTEEKRMEYARAITDASRRLANLITNILKLNKLENQQIYPSVKTYDLGEQLCECLLSFEGAWEAKDLEIHADVEEDILVDNDAELLALVWNNLFSNAIKFTEPHGKVSLSLKAEDGYAVVQVSDTGCGIPPEIGKHIFEKFYQGDTSHATQGNGLGLALVKRVIEIIGGDISVSSEVGKGSIFTVKLKKKQEPSNRVLS